MDWTQTLTIIGTILPAIAAFYYMIREDIKRHDAEFAETRKLWASLLEKIYNAEKEIQAIKLFQAHPLNKKKK